MKFLSWLILKKESDVRDYPNMVTSMDSVMEKIDKEATLRPTTIKWADEWTRSHNTFLSIFIVQFFSFIIFFSLPFVHFFDV